MSLQPKACLPPIVDAGTQLLILGSLPGDASLAAERYYAHPLNQFWRLLGGAIGEPLADLPYESKLICLRSRAVGLWDTIGTAVRRGSLDQAMRQIAPNALAELVATLPALQAVALNGATAARVGRRQLADAGIPLLDLPSSSPANTQPFAAKAEKWARLADWAAPPQTDPR